MKPRVWLLLATTLALVPIARPARAGVVATSVVAGEAHTCALTAAGAVLCWGAAVQEEGGSVTGAFVDGKPLDLGLDSGAASDGETVDPVPGLGSGVQALAAGGYHTCALTVAGDVKCWGSDDHGQLGDPGANTNKPAPVAVSGLPPGVTAIAAGGAHTCAVQGGNVWCWGSDESGQLGDGGAANMSQPAPVAVSGLPSGVTAIAAGGAHTCAVQSGKAWCWGSDESGQLGDGGAANMSQPTPVEVSGLSSGVTAIAAGGAHTCAVQNGKPWCWGTDAQGQLGDADTYGSEPAPVEVEYIASGVTAITAGGSHTCAVHNGGAKCWGSHSFGKLGGSDTYLWVSGLASGVTAIAAGGEHTCAVHAGCVKCWGSDGDGQLADAGTHGDQDTAVAVSGLGSGVSSMAAGGYLTCGIQNGAAKCWGKRVGSGQPSQAIPAAITSSGTTAIATNASHSCLVQDGGVFCLGASEHGEGNAGLTSGVTAIAAGEFHACAIQNGAAKCWGHNFVGQLGNGSTQDRTLAVQVSGLSSGVTAIAASARHSCAVKGGAAYCWGANWAGQLGNGSTTASSTPVEVFGLGTGVTAIAAGTGHTCAIQNGGAWCWGSDGAGRLGDGGISIGHLTPIEVSGLGIGVTAISAGDFHSCAVQNGAAWCWGGDEAGQLGDGGINASQQAPVAVSGLSSGVTAIAAGLFHSCAIQNDAAKCWGNDELGQLGDHHNSSNEPVASTLGCPCGDGVLDTGEQCDDGNITSADGCQPTCVLPGCGDAYVDSGEECDDGGSVVGDGCDGSCQIEFPWDCWADEDYPSYCELAECGDGWASKWEECDDGGSVVGDGCDGSCEIEFPWACSGEPSVCVNPCEDVVCQGWETCFPDGDCKPSLQSSGGCGSWQAGKVLFKKKLPRIPGPPPDPLYDVMTLSGHLPGDFDLASLLAPGRYSLSLAAFQAGEARGPASGPIAPAAPVFHTSITGGSSCGSRSCWLPTGSGIKYIGRGSSEPGISSAVFSQVSRTEVGIKFAGKGAGLNLPDALGLTLPVTIQLVRGAPGSGTSQCWQQTFNSATRNTTSQFSARE